MADQWPHPSANYMVYSEGPNKVVDCTGDNLEPFCGQVRDWWRRVGPRESILVEISTKCRLTWRQIAAAIETGRPSYIKAYGTQSRGRLAPFACANKCAKNTGMFPDCRILPEEEYGGGACGCCIYQDRAASCQHHVNYANSGKPPVTDAQRAIPAEWAQRNPAANH